jgi:predicted nucleic acid-binding protein
MAVLDTSAAIAGLVTGENQALLESIAVHHEFQSPYLIEVEYLHVLRRLAHRGDITPDTACRAIEEFIELPIIMYAQTPLFERMWQHRNQVSAYDAAYLALAESLEVPLITCDLRLARASDGLVEVELFDS